jgi:Glutathione S-transferase, N-terminal domain
LIFHQIFFGTAGVSLVTMRFRVGAAYTIVSSLQASLLGATLLQPDMASKYKLVYFDARGRGEPIRWIFEYAGKSYEDVRVKHNEWPALKATSPQGHLPYLEVDGKSLAQSAAIGRFLARRNGLAGNDDFEAAQAGQ